MAQPLEMEAWIKGNENNRSWLIGRVERLGRVNNDTLIHCRVDVVKVRLGIQKLVDILVPKLLSGCASMPVLLHVVHRPESDVLFFRVLDSIGHSVR
jgi:hypothetical protein